MILFKIILKERLQMHQICYSRSTKPVILKAFDFYPKKSVETRA